MTRSLVEDMVGNVNDFYSKGGFSETMNPFNIVMGKPIHAYYKNRADVWSYDLLYIGTKNLTKRINIPAIALRDSNEYGGNYFMSLHIGKHIHG